MSQTDIVKLKNELYGKLKDIDVKVLTLMKDNKVGFDYFRNPMYIACIKVQENLDNLNLEEVNSGMVLADEFLSILNKAIEDTNKQGEENGSN